MPTIKLTDNLSNLIQGDANNIDFVNPKEEGKVFYMLIGNVNNSVQEGDSPFSIVNNYYEGQHSYRVLVWAYVVPPIQGVIYPAYIQKHIGSFIVLNLPKGLGYKIYNQFQTSISPNDLVDYDPIVLDNGMSYPPNLTIITTDDRKQSTAEWLKIKNPENAKRMLSEMYEKLQERSLQTIGEAEVVYNRMRHMQHLKAGQEEVAHKYFPLPEESIEVDNPF